MIPDISPSLVIRTGRLLALLDSILAFPSTAVIHVDLFDYDGPLLKTFLLWCNEVGRVAVHHADGATRYLRVELDAGRWITVHDMREVVL